MKMFHYIALCLILQGAGNLAGQEVIHKASGSAERTFGKGISGVTVYGEKASVSVKGWSGSEVKVLFRPVSRNRDKEQAIADLKYIHYYVEKEGDRLVIRNSFKGKMEQITSNLSMEIEILMPASLPADITNLYGPVEIDNIASVSANVSFGSLSMTDIRSTCSITTRYSDIKLTSIHGRLVINAEKSDIRATALSAATEISCSYGKADLELTGTGPLVIKGYRTTVDVTVNEFEKYQYNLKAPQGKINLPQGKQIRNGPVEIQHANPAGLIDVTTSYCDITISTK